MFLSRFRKQTDEAEAMLDSENPTSLLVVPELCNNNKDLEEVIEPTSVINSPELAKRVYTVQYLYAVNKCRKIAEENLDYVDRKTYTQRLKSALEEYGNLNEGTKTRWEKIKRDHLARQPAIKQHIIDSIRRNPKVSWSNVEAEIGPWYSAGAIRNWLILQNGYYLYDERIIPLLSPAQQKSHMTFSKHFRNNWGLGPGTYLLIMYDEKWFWGMVCRKGAKACEELGIDAQTM
jgi:hypothetical protein